MTQLRGCHGQKIADVLLKLGTKLNCGLTFVEALNPNTSTVSTLLEANYNIMGKIECIKKTTHKTSRPVNA